MKCSNPECKKGRWSQDALELCEDCMKERATEYLNDPALRERRKAQEIWKRRKGQKKDLTRFQKIKAAAIALFQKCSELTIDSMDVLEKELAAMSEALKGGEE